MQVLLDTKKEYTKYIQESISVSIAQKINNYYDDATKNNLGMKGFQNNLNIIKKWNPETICEECEYLIKHSKYKNLDKKFLEDALMTSIAGISAAMKNTG